MCLLITPSAVTPAPLCTHGAAPLHRTRCQLRPRPQRLFRTHSDTAKRRRVATAALSSPAALLAAAGCLLLGAAALVFVVSAVPLLLESAKVARQTRQTLRVLEQEIPETAATLRLGGLELSDCIEEMSGLSAELSSGLQAAAQTVTDTRLALVESRTLAGRAMSAWLLPAVRQRVPAARGLVEEQLQKRARLKHGLKPADVLLAIAQAKQHTQRARLGLRMTKLLQITFGFAGLLRSTAMSQARRQAPFPPEAYS